MTNAELLKEIDRLDRQIKDEQQRAVQLRAELRNGSRSHTTIYEVKFDIKSFFWIFFSFSYKLKSKNFDENVKY
jgi:hypothetical protein